MAQGQSLSKAALIQRLRTTGQEVMAKLRALPLETYELGRYENSWNGRQILAHIASIEWTYARLIDLAQEAPGGPPSADLSQARRTTPEESAAIPSRPIQGGIDAYNARQVEKRANATIGELIEEFEANRARTVAALEAADDQLLSRPIRSAGGITGSLAGVLNAVAVEHVLGHVADIVGEERSGWRW